MEDAVEPASHSVAPTEPGYSGSTSSHYQSESPALEPQRQYSYSSLSTANVSPNFEPQSHRSYTSLSALTSPALLPQARNSRDLDHEATEALLLLNTDRRSKGARGMSVRDLLSA